MLQRFEVCGWITDIAKYRGGVCYLITEAAYRFYKTKCEEESSRRRGKEDSVKKNKRRHERVVRVSHFSVGKHHYCLMGGRGAELAASLIR